MNYWWTISKCDRIKEILSWKLAPNEANMSAVLYFPSHMLPTRERVSILLKGRQITLTFKSRRRCGNSIWELLSGNYGDKDRSQSLFSFPYVHFYSPLVDGHWAYASWHLCIRLPSASLSRRQWSERWRQAGLVEPWAPDLKYKKIADYIKVAADKGERVRLG